jgi:alcohol dehydrogenase class IV
MEYNAPAVKEKLAKVARELGGEPGLSEEAAASWTVARVKGMLETLDLPTGLSDINVPEEDLPALAEAVIKEKGYLARNPRAVGQEDAVTILEGMLR